MLTEIEDRFSGAGRTPKGERALRAIFRATRDTVTTSGLLATSLDVVADRAGLTQAALRHYFPTRDSLLTAFFVTSTEWFRAKIAEILDEDAATARGKLEQCLSYHLEYMENVDTAFWLEASAYWLRRASDRRIRDDWYRWLAEQYAQLIGRIQPAISKRERERRAYGVLTLMLGAWITHGRGSALGHPHAKGNQRIEQRQLLIDTALEIALQ